MIHLLADRIILPTAFCGSQCIGEGSVFYPTQPPTQPHTLLSVLAETTPQCTHSVPQCSLAGLVNHLPVTGGGKYNSGIGSPKVASGPRLSEGFGFLSLEVMICQFFFCHAGKTKNVLKEVSVSPLKEYPYDATDLVYFYLFF